MPKFSIEAAVGFGWKTVKEQWTTLIPATLILAFAGSALSSLIDRRSGRVSMFWESGSNLNFQNLFGNASANMLSTIIGFIFVAFMIHVSLKYVHGKAKDFSLLFQGMTPEKVVKVIGASILFNIVVYLGLILLIVPGVYFALRFSMVQYAIVDKDMGIMEAFAESTRLTDGIKWQLLLFMVVGVLIIVLGVIAFFVGMIVAVPVVLVASAHVYDQLVKSAGKAKPAGIAAEA